MTWPHLTPKQLVSISSRRIDLIRPPRNFHLSVPSPKPQIAMHTPRKWKRSKESVCKWTKMNSGPFKTSKLTIPDSFSINQNHLGAFQGPLTKFEKISDFAIFRVRKSTFQYFLRFFKNYWDFQTLLERIRKWLGNIKALNNWSQSPPEELI